MCSKDRVSPAFVYSPDYFMPVENFRAQGIGGFPAAARSKPWVCSRSLNGIAVSNPAWGLDVCLFCFVCCQVEVSSG